MPSKTFEETVPESTVQSPSQPVQCEGGHPIATGKVLAILPTYNEAENIETLIRELLNLPLPLSVLVIDDNSPDGTASIAQELGRSSGRVQVIRRTGKMGLGSAYLEGFRYALAKGHEFILTMDADFSHDPKRIPFLVAAMGQADVAVGSRYGHPEGGVRDWPWYRKMLSWGANILARSCLGCGVRDWTSGFRCYRREVLASLPLDRMMSQGYSCLVELLDAVQAQGWKIAEVPIVFVDRRRGKTKISQWEVYKGAWTLLRLWARR